MKNKPGKIGFAVLILVVIVVGAFTVKMFTKTADTPSAVIVNGPQSENEESNEDSMEPQVESQNEEALETEENTSSGTTEESTVSQPDTPQPEVNVLQDGGDIEIEIPAEMGAEGF